MAQGTESKRHKELKNFAIALARASGWQPEEIQEEYTYGGHRWDIAVVPNNIMPLERTDWQKNDRGKPAITFEAGNLNSAVRRPRGKARHWHDDEGILCLHLPYSLDVPEMPEESEPEEHEYIERLEPTIFRIHNVLDMLDRIGSNFPYKSHEAEYPSTYPRYAWEQLTQLEDELLALLKRVQEIRLMFNDKIHEDTKW